MAPRSAFTQACFFVFHTLPVRQVFIRPLPPLPPEPPMLPPDPDEPPPELPPELPPPPLPPPPPPPPAANAESTATLMADAATNDIPSPATRTPKTRTDRVVRMTISYLPLQKTSREATPPSN